MTHHASMLDTGDAPRRPSRGLDLDRLRAVLKRRKWLALLVFAGPFAAAVSITFSLPQLYRSTATILVERQQIPEAFVRATVTSELETRLQTISQKILSRARLEELIAHFNLFEELRPRGPGDELVERLRRDITLEVKAAGRQSNTVAFALSYTGRDPDTVARVTNTLATFYTEENLKAREEQAAGTTAFLRGQLAETKMRLAEQERRVSDFKKRYLGELPQQMPANLATIESLTAQLRLVNDNQVRASERRQTLTVQLAEAASIGEPTGAASGPQPAPARLARLKQELVELRTRYSDRYPDVLRVKDEIAAVQREIANGESDTANATPAIPSSPYVLRLREALHGAEAETKILKAEEGRLRVAIAAYQARVENTPRREQEFQDISRDYESTRELHQSLLKRFEEAQLAENMEQRQKGEQFRLLDAALPSTSAAAPKRFLLLAVAFVMAAGVAAVTTLVVEAVDTSFRTSHELTALTGIPVLARIPRIVTAADGKWRQRRFRLAALSVVIGLAVIVGGSYLFGQDNVQLVRVLDRGRR